LTKLKEAEEREEDKEGVRKGRRGREQDMGEKNGILSSHFTSHAFIEFVLFTGRHCAEYLGRYKEVTNRVSPLRSDI
jgi:hypothetical protein